MLSAGFIVTSLLWASALAAIIDRRLKTAAAFMLVAAGCSLFGVIHSPFPGSPIFWPWIDNPPSGLALSASAAGQTPIYLSAGYGLTALLLLLWSRWLPFDAPAPEPRHGDRA
jgi:AGZA family xanthine/uracil permease-like MFS transporter